MWGLIASCLNFQIPKIEGFEPKSNVVFTCQKHNPTSICADYIYPISYKIAKKGKSRSKSLFLLENDITGSEPTVKILDT